MGALPNLIRSNQGKSVRDPAAFPKSSILLGIIACCFLGSASCLAQTNRTNTALRWGENGAMSRWPHYSYSIKTAEPFGNRLPTLDDFPKLLDYSKRRFYDLSYDDCALLVSQLHTLSRCDFVDFQKRDYEGGFRKWQDWWKYYGSQLSDRLKKEGRTFPAGWQAVAGASGLPCPAYPLVLPSSWSFQLSFESGDYGFIVKEEVSMTVSPKTAILSRRYRPGRNAKWVSEDWEGLTFEQAQSFLACLIYAIDNPWLYCDDKLAAPRERGGHDHIKGRPD